MASIKFRQIMMLLAIFFIIGLIFSINVSAQTIYALIILMDSDVNISASVIKDGETVQKALDVLQSEGICQLNMKIIHSSEQEIKTSNMIEWIGNLSPSEDDIVMLYYSGHGFVDEQNRHYLSFEEGDTVARSDIIRRLNEIDCRLRILITDSCSNLVSLPIPITASPRSIGEKQDKKYYKDLFIDHKGLLDVTAASEGEYAWGNSTLGGYFTSSLFSSFKGDGSRFRTWEDVIKDAKDGVMRKFQETQFSTTDLRRLQSKNIKGQNPKVYSLPRAITSENIVSSPPKPDIKIPPPEPSEESPMVLIPAGEFYMGIDRSEIPELVNWAKGYDQSVIASWFEDETPRHKVYLDAYYIDVYEVTNEMYAKFLKATNHKPPKYWDDPRFNDPKQPVVGVTWEDAKAYCDWAGKRLPTEAEWEKAARGGLIGKRFPWGDDASHDYANYYGTVGTDVWGYSSPVGKFAPNGYGLYDMAGNVFEWCADWYEKDYYSKSPTDNPQGPSSGKTRVVRGGGYGYPINFLRVSDRFGSYFPSNSYPYVGFRCAK
ncbi:MAG: SUMF1/EgtB/PvdO family nonheme iron enzyme [Candidatus Poribacteria bacterium]